MDAPLARSPSFLPSPVYHSDMCASPRPCTAGTRMHMAIIFRWVTAREGAASQKQIRPRYPENPFVTPFWALKPHVHIPFVRIPL